MDWVTAVVDVKASTTTALSYDANGNRTGEGTKRYAWDIRDTLTRASDGATVLGTYDYDAKLQRVKADTTQGHVEYVLDGKYVLREAGARSRRYHFGEGEALAVTGVGGTSAQDRWLLIDVLGSVVTEANAAASSVTARQFDAWGNYRNNTAPTANETRLGYTGHQFDVETGLTYARARYYDSKLGIFLSRDAYEGALGEAPSLHRFAYTHNNPLRYTDPSGRCIGAEEGFFACMKEQAVGTYVDWKEGENYGPQPDQAVQTQAAKTGGVMSLQDQRDTAAVTRQMSSENDKARVMNNASVGEAVTYDVGERTGINSLMRARTGEDEMGRRLSSREVAEQAIEGGVKLAETTMDVAMAVETGGATLLEKKAAQQGLKQAAKQAASEATALEELSTAGAMMCPCFEAGTLVQTREGPRAIEEVRVGDLVLSRDDKTGAIDFRPVVQLFVTPEKEVFELRLADESGVESSLSVTPGHPFWVKDLGWVGAGNLASGIEVANSSGGWLRVTGATWHQRKTTVFNFEVQDFHTYFVGKAAAWVHNSCGEGCVAIVKWDGEFATKQLLGTSKTPGGKQINFHAADRMVNPPKGRSPMTPVDVDDFVDTADSIKKIKITDEGTSVTLMNSRYPKAQVVVDGDRIITVVNPTPKPTATATPNPPAKP